MEQRIDSPSVVGWLTAPDSGGPVHHALVLTHGAGSNSNAAILAAVARKLESNYNWTVLRCDLPFRRNHSGPPRPTEAAADREGLRTALAWLRSQVGPDATLFLGGHSYGGRQATMLASEDPALDARALLLLSYPLHPPAKPAQLRTAHLPGLRLPAFFAHGVRDTFGTREEMEAALRLIPSNTELHMMSSAGHELGSGKKLDFVDEFVRFATAL